MPVLKIDWEYIVLSRGIHKYFSQFFYPDAPIVVVTYADDTVTCTSDANPAAGTYAIIVNGTTTGDSPECAGGTCTLVLEVDYDTDVRCNATNTVGTGSAAIVAVPGRCTYC